MSFRPKTEIVRRTLYLAAAGALLVASAFTIPAQSRQANGAGRKAKTNSATPPVEVVNNPSPEYRSGEVTVAVRGNENPIIRLGLAQNGVTLIEFPASDRFFAINPGNPDLVTVEDSPTKETDRFFVVRVGGGFLPAPPGSGALVTSVVVQMTSGMVITFLMYPVRDIERNAHRCVITYDRDAVVRARRAAGLVANLDAPSEIFVTAHAQKSIRPATALPPPQASSALHNAAPAPDLEGGVDRAAAGQPIEPQENGRRFEGVVLSDSGRASKPLHGLTVTARTWIVNSDRRRVTVFVRNVLTAPVSIVPGYPSLSVYTLDDKNRILQVEPVAKSKVESSPSDRMIGPGRTAQYQITYDTPILGARQRLAVAVAQTDAADEPALLELTTGRR